MSDCENCGRADGHYLGCVEAWKAEREATPPAPEGPDQCAFGYCTNPRRPKGKGPAPKFCEEHSDPKNRK